MFKLKPHQVQALEQLSKGKILCGDVGSGKSLTAIAWYYLKNGGSMKFLTGGRYKTMSSPKDLYIITTARKRDTNEWEGELRPFLLSTVQENTKYKTVVVDSWNNIKKYEKIQNAYFIFDEDRITGFGTWAKTFLKIAKANEWIVLSATPGDTWMDYVTIFIANGFFKSKTEFCNNHVVWAHYVNFPRVSKYIGTGVLNKYRRMILVPMPFEKETEQLHSNIWCSFDIKKYHEAGKMHWDPYDNCPIENAGKMCLIWRRIVNSDESKINALLEIFDSHPKIIVFYNFNYELDMLRSIDFGPEVGFAEWNGHKHEPIPNTDSWVYCVQYNSGSEGWNCILTDTMVFFSENYSYRTMFQASGRIDRLNTPFKKLYYYHLKTKSPIDVAISAALEKKRDFNESKFVNWK